MVAPVQGLHEHPSAPLRCRHHVRRLGGIGGKGLFAQHVAARFKCRHSPLRVQRVGQRNVNRVQRLIGQQLLVSPVNNRDPVLLRERRGSTWVTRGYGRYLDLIDDAGRGDQRLRRDPRCSDYPDPHNAPFWPGPVRWRNSVGAGVRRKRSGSVARFRPRRRDNRPRPGRSRCRAPGSLPLTGADQPLPGCP